MKRFYDESYGSRYVQVQLFIGKVLKKSTDSPVIYAINYYQRRHFIESLLSAYFNHLLLHSNSFRSLRQLPESTCNQLAPVFSCFPSRLINQINSFPHIDSNLWRSPSHPMPRCQLILNVPSKELERHPRKYPVSLLCLHRQTSEFYTAPKVTQSTLGRQIMNLRPTFINTSSRRDPLIIADLIKTLTIGLIKPTPLNFHKEIFSVASRSPSILLSSTKIPSYDTDPLNYMPTRWKKKRITKNKYDNLRKEEEQKSLDDWWTVHINQKIIEPCSESEVLHIAPMHRVPKKSGVKGLPVEWRWIVDFRYLNKRTHRAIGNQIFCYKYDSWRHVAWTGCQKCVMKIDIASAFYSVPVHPDSKKYLGVRNKDKLCRFNSLPMGITDGPDIFSNFISWVLCHLSPNDHNAIINFCDDIVIAGTNYDNCKARVKRLLLLFHHFGLKINHEKSISPEVFAETTGAIVLGLNIQSGGQISIPITKVEKYITRLKELHSNMDSNSGLNQTNLLFVSGMLNSISFLTPDYLELFTIFIKNKVRCLTQIETEMVAVEQKHGLMLILNHLQSSKFQVYAMNPLETLHLTVNSSTFGWTGTFFQIDKKSVADVVCCQKIVWYVHSKVDMNTKRWKKIGASYKELLGVANICKKGLTIISTWLEVGSWRIAQEDEQFRYTLTVIVHLQHHSAELINSLLDGSNDEIVRKFNKSFITLQTIQDFRAAMLDLKDRGCDVKFENL